MFKKNKKFFFLFVLCLITRILFKFFSPYDNYQLFLDSHRYDELSQRIIEGNFNLDVTSYIIAPLYPYTLALFKSLSGLHWQSLVTAYQFLLVSFSAVYIYKISWQLFKKEAPAMLSALMYIFYPLTLWYNFTLVQETSFQAFFIFFIFHFLNICEKASVKNIFLGSLFFSLALLTKSHILILAPLLFLILSVQKKIKAGILFMTFVLSATIPHGLVNKKIHDVYTFSSQGNASLFLLGHNDIAYPCLMGSSGPMGDISTPGCDPDIVFDPNFEVEGYGKINLENPKVRNSLRFKVALDWIKSNPQKFIKLKWHGLKRFILPGLDYNAYSFKFWFLSFFAGLLIYIPAYWNIFKKAKSQIKNHLLVLSIILLTATVFIIFFPINRFRVITLEPFLIVYAGLFYGKWYKKIRSLSS